jgi:hypothetical protein
LENKPGLYQGCHDRSEPRARGRSNERQKSQSLHGGVRTWGIFHSTRLFHRRCPPRVKPRNTQPEQMSSALPPRTDVGVASGPEQADRTFWNFVEPSIGDSSIEGYGISSGKMSASCQRRSRQACRNPTLARKKLKATSRCLMLDCPNHNGTNQSALTILPL